MGLCADSSSSEKTHLCHVLATGVYPTLSVTDAHCYGSASSISKKQLWDLFSLERFVCNHSASRIAIALAI